MRLPALLVLALAAPAGAMDLSPDSRRAFGAEVRALLLDEPGLVIQAFEAARPDPSAIYAEAAEDDLALIANHADALFVPTGAGFGADTPDIVLTVFVAAASADCRAALADLVALTAEHPGLRVELRAFDTAPETEALLNLLVEAGPEALLAADWGVSPPGAPSDLAQEMGLDTAPSYLTRKTMIRGAIPPVVLERYLSE